MFKDPHHYWFFMLEKYYHLGTVSYIQYFDVIFSWFGAFPVGASVNNRRTSSPNWQGKNWVLNFSWRFRRFSANKSSKQNAETEQARPQLYFAPKIIKIHLVVLENELIEVCMLISKHCQKLSRVCHALLCVLLIKRTFTKVSIHIHNLSCMKALHTRDRFWHFFGINMQTSNNSFSKTTKRILMVFGATWSWGFACSVSAFCLPLLFAENRRNFQEKFRTRFFPLPVSRKTRLAELAMHTFVANFARNNGHIVIHHGPSTNQL